MTRNQKMGLGVMVASIVMIVIYLIRRKNEVSISPLEQITEMITGKLTITPERRAMLDTINWAEGSPGYNQAFNYKTFDTNAPHPNYKTPFGNGYSSAAGRYQFIYPTWQDTIKKLSIPDLMLPDYQDQAALQRIHDRAAMTDVDNGRIEEAITKLSYEWASLPPGRYGQPIKLMGDVLNYYSQRLQQLKNT